MARCWHFYASGPGSSTARLEPFTGVAPTSLTVRTAVETSLPEMRGAVGASQIQPVEFFQGFDVQALIEEQNIRRDPFFLVPFGLKAPRELRLSVKLLF